MLGLPLGRYGSASEVVRDALRNMEQRQLKLEALRAHLSEGHAQAERGEFVEEYSMDSLIKDLDKEV